MSHCKSQRLNLTSETAELNPVPRYAVLDSAFSEVLGFWLIPVRRIPSPLEVEDVPIWKEGLLRFSLREVLAGGKAA